MRSRIIHGPSYRFDGEQLTEPTLLWVLDHHFDDQSKHYPIRRLLDNSLASLNQHLLVFDDFLRCDDFEDVHHVCYPGLTAFQNLQYNEQVPEVDWAHKSVTFNFVFNKPRPHRIFLAKLLRYLGLDDYLHVCVWQHPVDIRDDLMDDHQRQRWKYLFDQQLPTPRMWVAPEDEVFGSSIQPGRPIAVIYRTGLKSEVFEPTLISLVTEPLFFENETMITEKTLMAWYGGTLPIWSGGWGIPDQVKALGFDIFSQDIDHSYQYHPDPYMRVYLSISLNLHLLKDYTRARQVWQRNRAGLEHNLQLCRQNLLSKRSQEIMGTIPNIQAILQQNSLVLNMHRSLYHAR